MSKTKQTYKLGKIKQLIDLNKDMTNFDLNFAVVSRDGSEFYAVVVDQTMLDNEPNPEYKKVKGRISGNIVADKGVYQNYFLLLKAENPCECDVILDIKEIPKNPNWEKQMMNTEQTTKTQITEHMKDPLKESMPMATLPVQIHGETKSKNMLLIVALIAFIGLILFFYLKGKSKSGSIESVVLNDNVSVKSETPSLAASPSPNYTSNFGYSRGSLFNKFR